MRLWGNTLLSIDKLTSTQTGADEVTETQLDLKAGHIFGTVKKMSAGSKYEVKVPNGVAGIRGTVYDISADGVIKVLSGSCVVAVVAQRNQHIGSLDQGIARWRPHSAHVGQHRPDDYHLRFAELDAAWPRLTAGSPIF